MLTLFDQLAAAAPSAGAAPVLTVEMRVQRPRFPSQAYVRKTRTAPLVCQQVVEPDWAALVRDINRRGYAKRQVAVAIGSTREVVYSMLRGNTPPWNVGAALLLLHEIVRREGDE